MLLALILMQKNLGKSTFLQVFIFVSNHKLLLAVEFSGCLGLAEDHNALKTEHPGREGVCQAVAGAQSPAVLLERSLG